MNPRAEKYLELLRADPSRPRVTLCEEIGVSEITAKAWRGKYPEFRAEETELREKHRVQLRMKRAAEKFLAREGASPVEVLPASTPLPAALERWMELFEQGEVFDEGSGRMVSIGRVDALRQVREEGLELDGRRLGLEDIEAATQSHPEFRRRFWAVWNAQNAEIEDEARLQARKGKGQVGMRILAAEKPDKYGNKVKVEHTGTVQLEAHHAPQLQQVKGGWWAEKQRRLKREEARLLAQSVPQEVIEGEVIS